ncbi:hypothetical protein IQ07DRAFT_634509 [Pyrenochaeta sp. DS3sAY3a]|nr:hypothetical protein IQ07DRAFT_634509 [Pyrenochaeta sp. DS3sAY3a]
MFVGVGGAGVVAPASLWQAANQMHTVAPISPLESPSEASNPQSEPEPEPETLVDSESAREHGIENYQEEIIAELRSQLAEAKAEALRCQLENLRHLGETAKAQIDHAHELSQVTQEYEAKLNELRSQANAQKDEWEAQSRRHSQQIKQYKIESDQFRVDACFQSREIRRKIVEHEAEIATMHYELDAANDALEKTKTTNSRLVNLLLKKDDDHANAILLSNIRNDGLKRTFDSLVDELEQRFESVLLANFDGEPSDAAGTYKGLALTAVDQLFNQLKIECDEKKELEVALQELLNTSKECRERNQSDVKTYQETITRLKRDLFDLRDAVIVNNEKHDREREEWLRRLHEIAATSLSTNQKLRDFITANMKEPES